MSQTQEKKSRFQVSREVQEEFVNGIAEAMLALTSKAAGKPHVADTPTGTPFCPTSGREYGGPNMLRLMLAGMEKGYSDDRWLTFKQVRQYQSEHPNLKVGIKKGEHGVKLLRPEEVFSPSGKTKSGHSTLRRKQEPLKRNAGRAQNFRLSSTRRCFIRSRSSMRSKFPACPPRKKRLRHSRNRNATPFWRNLSLIPALLSNTTKARLPTVMPKM